MARRNRRVAAKSLRHFSRSGLIAGGVQSAGSYAGNRGKCALIADGD